MLDSIEDTLDALKRKKDELLIQISGIDFSMAVIKDFIIRKKLEDAKNTSSEDIGTEETFSSDKVQ
jgi:hypothetical protein